MILAAMLWLITRDSTFDVHTLYAEGYTVAWQRDLSFGDENSWCELRDPRGRVVVRLQDYFCAPLGLHETDPHAVIDVDGDGRMEVVLETWSGGAHGVNTYQVWSLGDSPKCLLAWYKGNIRDEFDFVFEDLDGNGMLEVLTWYDGFAYSIQGAYSGQLPVVLALRGGQYEDATQSFPGATDRVWKTIYGDADPQAAWRSSNSEDPRLPSLFAQESMLRAFLYEWLRGSDSPVSAVLPRCSPNETKWLLDHQRAIKRCIALRLKRISHPRPYQKEAWKPDKDAYSWSLEE